MAARNAGTATAEERPLTEYLENGRSSSTFSSMIEPSIDATSVLSSGQSDAKVSASTSFASTVKLSYAQSGTSISGESSSNSYHPTASGSESDCPWLFCVEDGKILEVPRSSSTHGGGKFADKLARFPNVPKSPQLTPLPSPFASPPPSPSAVDSYFITRPLPTPDSPKKPYGRTTTSASYAYSLLSPYWERNAAGCSSAISPDIFTPYRLPTPAESSSIAEISFGELDVDLGGNFGSLASDIFPADSSSSSGYSTKLSIAQSATPSYGRHVRFESTDFRTSNTAAGSKRCSPHHRQTRLNQQKTRAKKKRRGERVTGRRNSPDAFITLVRSPGVDYDHLSSSFSSGSISKRGSWWQHGRLSVAIGRVRRGIRGCLSSQEEGSPSGTVWATEHDYWNNHSSRRESERSGSPMRCNDGRMLLRRIRRYTR